MKQVTTNQIAAFHSLLNKHSMMDDKRKIIAELSNGRCTSTKDLFFDELQTWIDGMNASTPKLPKEGSRMVRNIFAMAHELGWISEEKMIDGNGKLKAVKNYDALHNWVLKFGYLHKPLNDYTYKELPLLVTAFKNMYISKLKSEK